MLWITIPQPGARKKPEIAFNKVLRVDLECGELGLSLYAAILQLDNIGQVISFL